MFLNVVLDRVFVLQRRLIFFFSKQLQQKLSDGPNKTTRELFHYNTIKEVQWLHVGCFVTFNVYLLFNVSILENLKNTKDPF